jgi:hypothetical protein
MSNVICNFTCVEPVDVAGVAEGHTAIITWDVSEEIEGLVYNVYRDGVIINEVVLTEREYRDENLEPGTYSYQIKVMNINCISELSDPVSVTILAFLCEPPVNLDGVCLQIVKSVTGVVRLTWDKPENIDGELLGYNVYRDEEKINEVPVIETEYEDVTEVGLHTYQVSAVYEHCESDLTAPLIIDVVPYNNINDLQRSAFNLFPNPTTGKLTIENEQLAINSIEVYDVYGRKVLSHTANRLPQTVIDVTHLESGIYFVKIITDNEVVAMKFIKQ